MTRLPAALAAVAVLGAASGAVAATATAAAHAPPLIAAALADPGRPDADKAKDATRKPAETLAFAGVKPGMTVAELGPGGGYYTRLLAKAVGPKGKVYAVVTKAQAARPGGLDTLNAIAAANPNVTVLPVDSLPALVLPEKADLVWTTENYHDFHNGPTANVPGLDKAVYDGLKPGGIFYVEDHSAAAGAGLAAASSVHRMDEDVAKTELKAAGFKLDAEGDLLRNPADDKTGANNKAGSFVSDRFMLRMRR